MKKFDVEGSAARFGEGVTLLLTRRQYAVREHAVALLGQSERKDDLIAVKTLQAVEFKVGESIMIEGDERIKAITDPMTGEKQSPADRGRNNERKAAAKKSAGKAPAKRGR